MLTGALFALALQGSTIKVTLDSLCPGRISGMQCGQFIEYLCNLVPGMWAEKLYDGHFVGLTPYNFEFLGAKDFKEQPWYASGAVNRASYSSSDDGPRPGQGSQSIQVGGGAPATAGLSQDGIALEPKDPCRFSIWLKETGSSSPVRFTIRDRGAIVAGWSFQPSGHWVKFTTRVAPTVQSASSTLSISFTGPGQVQLQSASLMPESAVGGWRKDVVGVLRSLNPRVIRFGGSALDDPNLGHFEWKDSVGDPDFRKPFQAWGGLQQPGAGLEEIVQLCQAVNAEPLICIRTRGKTPQDAAEEVEYFNGAVTTPLGAWRARNGHPKPYGIKFWQVGNERGGPQYTAALPDYCSAIKKVDPKVQILSSYPSDAILQGSGKWLSFVCPHHYDVENLADCQKDLEGVRQEIGRSAPGLGVRVGITEWNTTSGDRGLGRARLWDLENALACARYQNLLQRNADLVGLANRSNLTNSFCSGIIQTDSARLYVTPTYWTQWLYSNLAGTRPLRIEPAASLGPGLDESATLSGNGRTLTLFAVNATGDTVKKRLDLSSFGRLPPIARVWVLTDRKHAGEPEVTNSFDDPDRISPVEQVAGLSKGGISMRFVPYSLTVIRVERP